MTARNFEMACPWRSYLALTRRILTLKNYKMAWSLLENIVCTAARNLWRTMWQAFSFFFTGKVRTGVEIYRQILFQFCKICKIVRRSPIANAIAKVYGFIFLDHSIVSVNCDWFYWFFIAVLVTDDKSLIDQKMLKLYEENAADLTMSCVNWRIDVIR